MKAWIVEQFRERDNLILKELDVPKPKADEVLVRIKACGINNKDIYIRKGVYYRSVEPPLILGSDMAGIVEDVGERVTGVQPGDKVVVSPVMGCGTCEHCRLQEENKCEHYRSMLGGFAEYIVLPERNVLPVPARFSLEEAAALPIAYMTAWNMLFKRAKVRASDTILFWGAASGVGTAGLLLFNNHDNAIAVAGSDEKVERLKRMGVSKTIHYKRNDVFEKVMEYTGGQGVDVIFDPVGEAAWHRNLEMLKTNGRHVNCARNTGADASVNLGLLFAKQISILGAKSGTTNDLRNIIEFLSEKGMRPVIDRTFPFQAAEEALQYMEGGNHFGKVVVTI